MRADEDLSPPLALEAMKQGGQFRYDSRVKRQLRFFEEERSIALQKRPEPADQSQSSIGKLILLLSSGIGAPVFIGGPESCTLTYLRDAPT